MKPPIRLSLRLAAAGLFSFLLINQGCKKYDDPNASGTANSERHSFDYFWRSLFFKMSEGSWHFLWSSLNIPSQHEYNPTLLSNPYINFTKPDFNTNMSHSWPTKATIVSKPLISLIHKDFQ